MPGKVNEQAWDKAKSIVRREYPKVKEGTDKFWSLVQGVYKNMNVGQAKSKLEKAMSE